MADALALDRTTVSAQLTSVAKAFAQLDEVYGQIAAIPYGSQYIMAVGGNVNNGTPWGKLRIMSLSWFGVVDPANEPTGWPLPSPDDSWRSRIVHDLFAPFDAEITIVNCVEPLTILSQIEREIRAAGGAATADQKQQVVATLESLQRWLAAQATSVGEGCTLFRQAADSDAITVLLQGEVDRGNTFDYHADGVTVDLQTAVANVSIFAYKLLHYYGKGINVSTDVLNDAWGLLRALTESVTTRTRAAQGEDVGSILQGLDIDASLKEWPVMCGLAQQLRPGPPPPIPPPTDGLGFVSPTLPGQMSSGAT